MFVLNALNKEYTDEKRQWQKSVKDLQDRNIQTDAHFPIIESPLAQQLLVAETSHDTSTGQSVVTIKKNSSQAIPENTKNSNPTKSKGSGVDDDGGETKKRGKSFLILLFFLSFKTCD
jgi:hypothetical protein